MFSSNSHRQVTQLTCGFKVNTNCPEWHKSMTRILKEIKGGDFWLDTNEGMAYVSGEGDPNKVMKLMGSRKHKSAQVTFVKTGGHHHHHQDQHHQHEHRHHHYHHHPPHHNPDQNRYSNSEGHYNSYWPSDSSYSWQHSPHYSQSPAMQPNYHNQYSYGPDDHHQCSYDPGDYPHQEYY